MAQPVYATTQTVLFQVAICSYIGEMTDEDKAALAAAVAEVLEDTIYDGADLDGVARIIVDRIGSVLHQQGWWPPETGAAVARWGMRLGEIPDKHLTRAVLTSHQCELAEIVHRQ